MDLHDLFPLGKNEVYGELLHSGHAGSLSLYHYNDL
jgi:hypothetical protein